ncbi:hypothetical protein ACFZC7_21720 [Streptomyces massasporeus]|uniref:hypothetical protein n=1 Tax=Streptomyces massasporeus TaxID=67324 RepID=UPI0036E682CE
MALRSRRDTEMGPAFPEIVAGAAQLPDATSLDGELVVWEEASPHSSGCRTGSGAAAPGRPGPLTKRRPTCGCPLWARPSRISADTTRVGRGRPGRAGKETPWL